MVQDVDSRVDVVEDLWARVQGSGFKVLGIWVLGLGLRVEGLGCRA